MILKKPTIYTNFTKISFLKSEYVELFENFKKNFYYLFDKNKKKLIILTMINSMYMTTKY